MHHTCRANRVRRGASRWHHGCTTLKLMATVMVRPDIADGAWLGHGAVGGLLGGIALLGVEIALAAIAFGKGALLLPVRMAAGILLGPGAVDPAAPAVPVVIGGLLVHATLSATFGLLFASIMERRPRRRPTSTMVLAAILYGCALCAVNFYVIAPLFGWDWFPRRANPVGQLVAHALVFAPIVAGYLQLVDARRRKIVIVETAEPTRLSRRRAA